VLVEREPIVAVLGAINVDLVVSGAPLPGPGETVTGGTFAQHHGGKGGNQAVAARRALDLQYVRMFRPPGDPQVGVWMLGAVGDDQLGRAALEALGRTENVRTDHVLVTSDAPTGVALIAVGPDGENQISVAPGANARLEPAHVVSALDTIRPLVLLVSLEVPERTVRAAIQWGRDHAVTSILNPAPPRAWAKDLVPLATYVTPNEHERAAIDDIPPGVTVVETSGREGVTIDRDGERERVPAPIVPVVDTTGAGDCFNGVLAAGLAEGHDLADAVRDAIVAASLSVGVPGAREGMPRTTEIAEARIRFRL
jgi:ribokinase